MQPTSAQTYKDILSSGRLGEQQREVLKLLFSRGAMTGSEINDVLGSSSGHKRLSELSRMGVVQAGAPRICAVTQREAIAWEPTGRGPSNAPPKAGSTPSRAQMEEALKELRALIRFRKLHDAAYTPPDDLVAAGAWIKKKALK